jgi:transcriptional regulator with XRE-family HTH domain
MMPTPEQLAARQLRLLRQGRGWSQLEVAEKMGAYGYQWSQATVTRLEAATRPIRLNELTDLAALYGVPVAQLLESGAPDDLEALDLEIEKLRREHLYLTEHLHQADVVSMDATKRRAEFAAHLARVDGRLETLLRWHPAARDPRRPAEGGDGK